MYPMHGAIFLGTCRPDSMKSGGVLGCTMLFESSEMYIGGTGCSALVLATLRATAAPPGAESPMKFGLWVKGSCFVGLKNPERFLQSLGQ